MRDDRAAVLGQIRIALQNAHLPAARATLAPRVAAGKGDVRALTEKFRAEVEPLGGMTYVARSDAEAIELVLKILREANGRELLTWDDAEISVRGLGDALARNGYTRLQIEMPLDADARKTKLLELERAAAGITGALAGIADTGSLALVSAATRPRLASLLPATHIAFLKTSALYPNMASFFAAHPHVTRDASNVLFITGPSRTADIELTLQRGVHGPKFLHIVFCDWL
jgi:L-lactate dehydrogenase complex protein LldG